MSIHQTIRHHIPEDRNVIHAVQVRYNMKYVLYVFKHNQQFAPLHNDIYYYNALHVSGGSSAYHQELKTVYTASAICRAVIIYYNKLLLYKISWIKIIVVKGSRPWCRKL